MSCYECFNTQHRLIYKLEFDGNLLIEQQKEPVCQLDTSPIPNCAVLNAPGNGSTKTCISCNKGYRPDYGNSSE